MADPKLYYQGTQNDFDVWHAWVCAPERENIPAGGKINKILDKEVPDRQRTISYSEVIPHGTNPDDFIWFFGDYPKPDMELTEYTQAEAISNGYITIPDEILGFEA